MLAKLVLFFRKSGSLNLTVGLEFRIFAVNSEIEVFAHAQ